MCQKINEISCFVENQTNSNVKSEFVVLRSTDSVPNPLAKQPNTLYYGTIQSDSDVSPSLGGVSFPVSKDKDILFDSIVTYGQFVFVGTRFFSTNNIAETFENEIPLGFKRKISFASMDQYFIDNAVDSVTVNFTRNGVTLPVVFTKNSPSSRYLYFTEEAIWYVSAPFKYYDGVDNVSFIHLSHAGNTETLNIVSV